jgi:hypothetical protein
MGLAGPLWRIEQRGHVHIGKNRVFGLSEKQGGPFVWLT